MTRKDKIRNEYVRGTAKIAKLGEKLRNVRLRWYGHVKRREEDYVGKRMMEMAVPGRRKRGRPRRRWMDLVKEDMERVGAREGDEVDRVKWRLLSRCGDSREKPKEEEDEEDIQYVERERERETSSSFGGHPLQVRRKLDWGRGFILLLPQTAALHVSDAGSGVIKPASSFVIQNRQTLCSMWCPMYRAHC